MNRRGKLYFRYGTMGSAKTALLLTTAYNFEERGMEYLCMKPIIDTREKENVIKSRIGIKRECLWIYQDTDLYELVKNIYEETLVVKDWILIDEAQFLSDDEINTIKNICASKNVTTLCFGLLTTFQFELFEGSKKLVECADSLTKISMPCENCNQNEAICNFRMSSNNELVVLDKNQYKSLCEDCYKKFISYQINEDLVTNFLQFNSCLISQ